jgi:hypothetical protein
MEGFALRFMLCSCTIALLLVPSHFWHSSGSNLVAHSLVIDGCSQPGVRWLCVRTGTLASLPALVGSATFPVGLPCFLPIPMWGPYGVGMAATVPTWDVAPWMVCLLLHLFTCRGRVGGSVSSAFVFAHYLAQVTRVGWLLFSSAFVFAHTLLKSLVRGGFCSLRQVCLHILAALRACRSWRQSWKQ